MPTDPISPKQALYIKLGVSGEWERECITVTQTLRLGYREASHDLCLSGNWEAVLEEMKPLRKRLQDAKSDVRQIRDFYEADEKVLWVTFFGDRLYWC